MKTALLFAAALILSACASMPVGGVATPSGSPNIPAGALDLGDWRTASQAATLSAFQQNVASRYGVGVAISAASADLRRNEFNCGAAPDAPDDRGDPPATVCRRTITLNGCTHTWQVHLFDANNNGQLARTRGLYDRRCGNEGLLGGPG
jgi:hypothetical protein